MMGFDWAAADEEAQHLAPGVSDRLADRMDELLGHPSTCPHGNLIPGRKPPYGKLISLADMPVGASAHIRRISEVAEHDAPDLLADLRDYGLVTGNRDHASHSQPRHGRSPDPINGEISPIGTSVARLIWVEPTA